MLALVLFNEAADSLVRLQSFDFYLNFAGPKPGPYIKWVGNVSPNLKLLGWVVTGLADESVTNWAVLR